MKNKYEIPYLKKKSNSLFIKNKYEINNIHYDDLSCIIYFINKNKIKIIIRKYNLNTNGWVSDIQIKLFSMNKKEQEIIHVGSCSKHYKIINYFTKINVNEKSSNDIKIPKVIYQYNFNNQYNNNSHYNAVQSIFELNPSYDYQFYNDQQCRSFIKKYFDKKVVQCYDKLFPILYKSDLFRYCLLYIKGGIFIDDKFILRKSFDDLIDEYNTSFYCQDADPELICNTILITQRGNEKYKQIIDTIVNNMENHFYGKCPEHPTGSRLFGEIMNNEQTSLYFDYNEEEYYYKKGKLSLKKNNELFLNTLYDGLFYNDNNSYHLKHNYEECFNHKLIYLKYEYKLKKYIFYLLTLKENILFKVVLFNESDKELNVQIQIEGIKENQLHHNEQLICIDDENNNMYYFNLIDVYNKIIKLNNIKKIDLKQF